MQSKLKCTIGYVPLGTLNEWSSSLNISRNALTADKYILDGEYAELELCDAMRDGKPYTDIESLYFKLPDGSFKHNPIRPLFADLDRIPIPDFDLFDYANSSPPRSARQSS